MRAHLRLLIACLLAGLSLAGLLQPALAQDTSEPVERDRVFEQEILDQLAALNPQAVPIFKQATANMDQGDYAAAKTGFEEVLSLAPDFPDALRRLSSSEMALELYQEALGHAQRAYDIDPSAYNAIVLADVLMSGGVMRNDSKALSLARQAIQELPEDPYANHVLMIAAAFAQDNEALRTSTEKVLRLMPENPYGHYFYGLLEANEGHWEQAEAALLKAKELGIPAEIIDQVLKDTGIATQALFFRLLRWSGYGLAGWLGGMLVLFLAGLLLSQLTLSAVRQAQASLQTEPGGGERLVRSIYRLVITLTSLYFYISIPFVILVIVAATAGLFYLFFAVGRIPLRLALMIGLAALYTLYAVVRSVFTRIKEQEPGRPLSEAEAPALWRLTGAVADKLNTRPIQAIYITPGTEIAVLEQGGFWQKMLGRGWRTLILGMGVLSGLTQGQFKSILAHEYGHFTGKDTAGGGLARQVQLSIHNMAHGLAVSGQARWYNPAWLFINGFYRVFLRITHGASRLQEILADRYAALAYGSRNLIEGLKHVVRQAINFDLQVNIEVNQSIQQGGRLNNLYTLPEPQEGEAEQKLAEAVQQALERQTSAYDTHPSPVERFRLIEKISAPERSVGLDDERAALDLLPNASLLQQEMTDRVQANVDAQLKQMGASPQA